MPHQSAQFLGWCNYFKILPHCAVDYTLWKYDRSQVDYRLPDTNTSKGIISNKAAVRIRRAMNWMVLFSHKKWVYDRKKERGFYFKINFITLTLSAAQNHSDSHIVKHMLEPLLRWLQRSCGVINYVWKAETQDNGNIHFHITLNKFVHYRKLRNKWNDLQRNHGYVRSLPGDDIPADPNSTDVKSVINMGKIISYMTKYITKTNEERKNITPDSMIKLIRDNTEREIAYMSIAEGGVPYYKRPVTCKVWSCNHSLSNLNITLSEEMPEYFKAKQHFKDNYCKILKEDNIMRIYSTKLPSDPYFHPLISEAFDNAYTTFMTNDDGKTKYIMEE